ncbi:MarR family transcriptional regulator [Novosphingobium sp.]|uniref:MarR family winged helix-turn-helix transcriptional regulator n=1 Tax=Novosphingobium sp. TaxID=1874826 RepID=UPI0025E52772|nr:MarR family transcriptional regulator [Novosphingobium sp.]
MKDPLVSLPGYALRRAASAMIAELGERLVEIGLRHTDVSILILIEANARITASALGRALDIKRANMVPLVGRLEAGGLIERRPIDGKSHSLELTARGRTRLAEAWAIIEQFEAELLARVPAAHRDHLLPALNALWQGPPPTLG